MSVWRESAGLLLLALLPLAAQADTGWSPGIDIGGGVEHSHMQELIDGQAQVTESGFLAEDHGRIFVHRGNLEFGLTLADSIGSINYNGQSQNAKTLAASPYQTTSDAAFLTTQLDTVITIGALRLSGFGGYNIWQRSVLSSGDVGESDEDYRWFSIGLGASYRIPLRAKLALVPELRVWDNVHVRQSSQSGDDDTAHLEPGSRAAGRLSVALAWALPSKAELRVGPFIQVYSFGTSGIVPLTQGGQPVRLPDGQATGVYQPEIHYLQYGVDAEYEVRF